MGNSVKDFMFPSIYQNRRIVCKELKVSNELSDDGKNLLIFSYLMTRYSSFSSTVYLKLFIRTILNVKN